MSEIYVLRFNQNKVICIYNSLNITLGQHDSLLMKEICLSCPVGMAIKNYRNMGIGYVAKNMENEECVDCQEASKNEQLEDAVAEKPSGSIEIG